MPWWKRPFDIGFSIVALVLSSPLLLVIAIAIKLFDGGNVLYKHKRVGLNGKVFYLYKFRTMYNNNNVILSEFLNSNPKAKEEWIKYRKLITYDPRVTKIGKILRKYSLDELPQFFNVLKGDMSVVGPRPYIEQELVEYNVPEDIKSRILSVKPGITGLWQVTKRNTATMEERLKMESMYSENISFWHDIKIILRTVYVVFKGFSGY